ncbi:protein TolQ [Thiohalobacter thiocyanaticus]|uniref:Tol-Pal system protein TolQ n=1 Tax=Thiohalobacter thiocyanaticus TaxID=585455 RepID=A0A426QHF6_9GAMM|nr:protein TolQ [Thiohalobacter thiocyanaticus]RRQ21170.1 protein TolQ [Thiohalobacter thiocyanaticus]
MSTDLSMLHLILGASPVVQLVMLLLVALSLISWTLIFHKWKKLGGAQREAKEFEQQFWSGGELAALYQQVAAREQDNEGMADIFEAGFREYSRLRKQPQADSTAMVEGAQRSMRVALSREEDRLETGLSFLATVGSTSPYIGLFGTVWGIMNAFRSLGNVHQATLAMVAPGIAEALIATAMGLFAAIPAVIAYNRFSNDVERLANRYDNFLEEFAALLHRQSITARKD